VEFGGRGAYVGGVDAVDRDDKVAITGGVGGGEGAGNVTNGGGGGSGEAGVTRLRSERRMGLGFSGRGDGNRSRGIEDCGQTLAGEGVATAELSGAAVACCDGTMAGPAK
jgi:hypothetical protein